MTPEVSQAACRCLTEGAQALVAMYTNTALLLNSCDVAARGYAQRTDAFRLSTTQNIPGHLRLPIELDVSFLRDQLPGQYQGPVLQRISEDFLIRMITVIDGVLEDVYEETVRLVHPELNEAEVLKRVRSAWQQDANGHIKLLNFLTEEAGLKSPAGKVSTVQMVFDRYYELREVRHALVHTGGVLSPKHLERLQGLAARLPAHLRNGSIATATFLASGSVVLTVPDIIAMRHWAYTTIVGYLQGAFATSVIGRGAQA